MQRISMKCAAAMVVLAMGIAGASAAETSPCKGLTQDACQANKICSWVKPHKTKAGKEAAGLCRKKPVRQKASPAAPKS